MRNRREFITTATGAAVGMLAGGSGLLDARAAALLQVGAKPGKRREVTIAGKRVKTVDLHAHCFVPEVMDLVKDTPLAQAAKGVLGQASIHLGNPQRLIDMDAQGIDYQAINVNAWGYNAEKALARDLVALQNERISQYVGKNPDRFVGMATLALQFPELAVPIVVPKDGSSSSGSNGASSSTTWSPSTCRAGAPERSGRPFATC